MQQANAFRITGSQKDTISLLDSQDAPADNPIPSLVHTVRQQLLDHQSYREPYLKCLLALYRAGESSHQGRIRRIRPSKPTDSDIRDFILFHWPEVQLRSKRDFISRIREEVKKVRPLDDAIHLSCGLVTDLIGKVGTTLLFDSACAC